MSDVCNKVDTMSKVLLTLSERLLEKDRAQDKTCMNKNRMEYSEQEDYIESFYLETTVLYFQKKEHLQESQKDRNKSVSHLQESPRQEESNATGEGEQLLGDNE